MRLRQGKKGIEVRLFDLEAEIMDVVWSRHLDRFAVSDVLSVLERRRQIAYTTVMTTLARLYDKGVLRRHRDGKRYLYSARLSREEFLQSTAREVLEGLGDSASKQALALLVETVSSADEQVLADLERNPTTSAGDRVVNEVVFPLVGPLLVFAIVLPLSAGFVRLLFVALDRFEHRGELHNRQGLRYVLLVASSGAPLTWFISASLHQAETGRSASVCMIDHAAEAFCPEAALFAGVLVLGAALFAAPRLLREEFASTASTTLGVQRACTRLQAIVRSRPGLTPLRDRWIVRDVTATPIATVGVLVPRVVLRTSFVAALDDEALVGALHHELEHVRGHDPLRYFAAWWALAVNPFGRWLLDKEFSRWLLAREVHCDREAVLDGAGAPALAQALVTAARPATNAALPALGNTDASALRLRVGLLLAYSEQPPHRCCGEPALRLALVALLLFVVLPHGSGTHALDAVHVLSERAVSIFADQ